jgi:hypothetical protein
VPGQQIAQSLRRVDRSRPAGRQRDCHIPHFEPDRHIKERTGPAQSRQLLCRQPRPGGNPRRRPRRFRTAIAVADILHVLLCRALLLPTPFGTGQHPAAAATGCFVAGSVPLRACMHWSDGLLPEPLSGSSTRACWANDLIAVIWLAQDRRQTKSTLTAFVLVRAGSGCLNACARRDSNP